MGCRRLAISYEINSVDKTAYIKAGSFRVSKTINGRATASVTIRDPAGAYRPEIGHSFEVYDGATLVWGGSVDDLPEEQPVGTSMLQYVSVSLVDNHELADRRLVAETYESDTAGDIVTGIITNYLAAEGITAGTIQTGITIQKAVFNYIPASRCLDEICTLTGFQWRINADKSLDFFDRATYTGTALTASSGAMRLRVKRDKRSYRNRQYVRAGYEIATAETRNYVGDGNTQVFNFPLPLAAEPTITLGAAAQTVGIRGLETGHDWYWQKSDKTVSQDIGSAAPGAGVVVAVTGQGYIPIMVVADSPEQIEARKAISGGTGLYENLENRSEIDTDDAALEYSSGLLRKYAAIQKAVMFDHYTAYEPGQLVTVTLAAHGISAEQMLVSDVTVVVQPTSAGEIFLYQVKLVSGENLGGWVQFFKKLVERTASFTIRENELLVKLLTFADTANLPVTTDSMTYSIHQYLLCSTTTICGTAVII